jgi:hypothetical protein
MTNNDMEGVLIIYTLFNILVVLIFISWKNKQLKYFKELNGNLRLLVEAAGKTPVNPNEPLPKPKIDLKYLKD